jgi:hypothetical protein
VKAGTLTTVKTEVARRSDKKHPQNSRGMHHTVFSLVLYNGGKLESYLPELLDSKIEGGHLANYFVPQKPRFPLQGQEP